jgi:hypothetical protein
VELAVTCTDQSEWGGDPEWCLPTLALIETDQGALTGSTFRMTTGRGPW